MNSLKLDTKPTFFYKYLRVYDIKGSWFLLKFYLHKLIEIFVTPNIIKYLLLNKNYNDLVNFKVEG